MKYRIGFLTSHPIQYQVPVFRELAKQPDLDFTVFYCQLPDAQSQGDGFGTAFTWDIPLLDGYQYEVLNNVAARPSVTEFAGCDTPSLLERIRHHNLDALVINGWVVKSCLQGLRACRRTGIPCIVRGEANNIRPRPWWKRLLQRQLVRQYSACLYIGKANYDFYRAYGIPESRLFPALYCIDNNRFASTQDRIQRQEARQAYQLSPNVPVYLFSGKLIPKKRPLEFLGAVREAIQRGAAFECLIVGDGELRAQCEAYVREHNLPVRFAGFQNQSRIVAAYVAADCLVLPSDYGETWGLVVNEAMSCGRPAIVSSQVGCAADLVISGQTGEIFEFGNWSHLSDILYRTAANPGQLNLWGKNARQHIDLYSPQAAARGIHQAVTRVCRVPAAR